MSQKYKYAGILPYARDTHDSGKVFFLLGRERYERGWEGSLKWSEFGGRVDVADKDIYHTAAREAYEESMGFLGTTEEIYDKIFGKPGYLIRTGFSIPMEIEYDSKLPDLFKRVYNYGLKVNPRPPAGLMEKIEIKWMTTEEIKDKTDIGQEWEIRPWYRKIILEIISHF